MHPDQVSPFKLGDLVKLKESSIHYDQAPDQVGKIIGGLDLGNGWAEVSFKDYKNSYKIKDLYFASSKDNSILVKNHNKILQEIAN